MAKILLIILFSLKTFSQEDDQFRYVENEAFGLGELLEYNVGYKFIKAGEGFFYIKKKPVEVSGRKCYDVHFGVRSLESLEWLYKVRDSYNSKIDIGGIFPWEYRQKIRENNYRRKVKAEFDHRKKKAYTKKDTFDIPKYVHDIVSAFYCVRTLDLKNYTKDSVISLQNFYKDSTYTLDVIIHGREVVEVPAGKFKCVKIEPLVQEGGLFKSEGSIVIWVTDDDRKIPVKVGTEIVIGFVGAELRSYNGLRGPLDAKIE